MLISVLSNWFVLCLVPLALGQDARRDSSTAGASPSPLIVTVTDSRGKAVTGLTQDRFTVSVDGAELVIAGFATEPVPMNLAIIADVSASMERLESRVALVLDALLEAIRRSQAANVYSVYAAGRRPHLLVDSAREPDAIASGFAHLRAYRVTGATALYDALLEAAVKVERGPNSKRVIFAITDGDDTDSRASLADVYERFERANVLFYALDVRRDTRPDDTSRRDLIVIASETGGLALFPRADGEIATLVNVIAAELSAQYLISAQPRDGWRGRSGALKVTLSFSQEQRLKVRNRRRYVASTP